MSILIYAISNNFMQDHGIIYCIAYKLTPIYLGTHDFIIISYCNIYTCYHYVHAYLYFLYRLPYTYTHIHIHAHVCKYVYEKVTND